MMKLHPNQFQVNQAWIIFKLSGNPWLVDGSFFHCYGMMDAASCFILSTTLLRADLSLNESSLNELFEKAWVHKKTYCKELIVVDKLQTPAVTLMAGKLELSLQPLPEKDVKIIIGEAQSEFRHQFG